jgi:RNA polymerase sigma-70 factor (ECF subfamily)
MRGDVEQALQLIQGGSPASLDKALGLLQDTVFSFSMKACEHWQDAEDTAQDVLLRSIPHLSKFESPKALAVWLYRVARNRCISSHRENKVSGAKNVSLDELMPQGRRNVAKTKLVVQRWFEYFNIGVDYLVA